MGESGVDASIEVEYTKPIPRPDAHSQPFFDGTLRGELMLQRCGACSRWMWPVRARCIECFSDDLAWTAASGTGTLYSYTLVHQVFHPGFASEVPYNVAMVDLDEGVRMVTNIVGLPTRSCASGCRSSWSSNGSATSWPCRSSAQPRRDAVTTAPLQGVRVVDTTDDSANFAGRLLADLGADVILVEPPGGSRGRALPPFVDGASLSFSLRNANKRSVVLDTETAVGQQQLLDMLGRCRHLDRHCSGEVRRAACSTWKPFESAVPDLVVVSVRPFGEAGPYAGYQASDPVLFALSGMLSLSRLTGRPPLPPPGRIAYDVGGAIAAYIALVGLWNRLETGGGHHFHVSLHEAMVQAGDAVLPVAEQLGPRGPISYPTYRCTDGFVRIVLLLPRHTEAMLAWLDEGRDGGPLDRANAAEVGRRVPALLRRARRGVHGGRSATTRHPAGAGAHPAGRARRRATARGSACSSTAR